MDFLRHTASDLHSVRRADWRVYATPTEQMALQPRRADDADAVTAAPPGSRLTIELEVVGAPIAAAGTLLVLLPFAHLKSAAEHWRDFIDLEGADGVFFWPLLEVRIPVRRLRLKNFPIPEQPGKISFEAHFRTPDARFYRLRESALAIAELPPESAQLYLSSNFSGGVLRYAVAAEQPEAQHFMPSSSCDAPFTLTAGDGSAVGAGRFQSGLATGVLPTPQRGGFTLKTFFMGRESESNYVDPDFFADTPFRLYWGDLHAHSRESDGAGEPEELIHRARDWKRLDFFALNEHIENSLAFRVWTRAKFDKLRALYDGATQNGEFVMIGGFEYHSYCNLWCFSDRYTDYLDPAINADDAHPILAPGDPEYPAQEHDVEQRIAAIAARPEWLAGYHRLEVFHEQAPLLPPPVHLLQLAHYSRPPEIGSADFLARGDRSGFFGGTDTHLGIPAQGKTGGRDRPFGLTGVLAPDLTRAALHGALRARRTYATQGTRTLVDFRVNGAFAGTELRVPVGEKLLLTLRIAGKEPIRAIELVSRDGTIAQIPVGRTHGSWRYEWRQPSEWQYFFPRIILEDKRMAWASPVWCLPATAAAAPNRIFFRSPV